VHTAERAAEGARAFGGAEMAAMAFNVAAGVGAGVVVGGLLWNFICAWRESKRE